MDINLRAAFQNQVYLVAILSHINVIQQDMNLISYHNSQKRASTYALNLLK